MTYRQDTVRFHVKTGPESLFHRVRFKMRGKRQLRVHGSHLKKRASDRAAPLDSIMQFDADEWDLRTAEVNARTGKFVSSSWSRSIDGQWWWIVIGLNDTLLTIIDTNKFGLGPCVVQRGELYNFVEKTNSALMAAEGHP